MDKIQIPKTIFGEKVEGAIERALADAEKKGGVVEGSSGVLHASSDAFFLTGNYGREFLKEYNGIVDNDYDGNSVLKVLEWNDEKEVVTGSNDYSVVLANMIFIKRGENLRTATPADLEKILKNKTLVLEDHYEDSALCWRSNKDPNIYLAKALYESYKNKGIIFKEGTPYICPLFSLSLKKDSNSLKGISFEVFDDSCYFEAPILNQPSQLKFEDTDIDEDKGIPKDVRKNGTRTLYTRNSQSFNPKNSGLCRFYLGRGLGLVSDGGLEGSVADGRVVAVRAGGTPA